MWLSDLNTRLAYYEGMPSPRDTAGVQRYPHEKKDGIYLFLRQPLEHEIEIYEPRDERGIVESYILTCFECERFLNITLRVPEKVREALMNRLYNFNSAQLHPATGRVSRIDQRVWQHDRASEDLDWRSL